MNAQGEWSWDFDLNVSLRYRSRSFSYTLIRSVVTGISNHRFDRRKDCFWRSCKDEIGSFDERRNIPLTEYYTSSNAPDGTVEIRKIAINRDLGTKLEISQGLSQTDPIITGPPAGLVDGSVVNAASSNEAEIE